MMSATAKSNEVDFYTRMVALEKEVKIKEAQLDELVHEKKALEKAGRNKEVALLQMTTELMDAKKKIATLEYDVEVKAAQAQEAVEYRKANYNANNANIESLRRLELETIGDGRTKLLPVDLYHHVMRLENELEDYKRVTEEHKDEVKTLQKALKLREDDVLKLEQVIGELRAQFSDIQDPVLIENKFRELNKVIVELQDENKILLQIQKAKTQAIEELTLEVNRRGATDEYVSQLQGEARETKKEIVELKEEIQQLQKICNYKEEIIEKYRAEDVGIPFHLWQEERRLLKAEVIQMREERGSFDKTIKSQRERIQQLQDSMDVILKSCDLAAPPSKTLRQVRRSSSSQSSPATPSPTLSRSTNNNGSPDFSSNTDLNELNAVPRKQYELLERNIKLLTQAIAERDTALSERDEALELLERKIEVISRARASESKKAQRKRLELVQEISEMSKKISSTEGEAKERENSLKLELGKLKRKAVMSGDKS